MCGLVGMAGSLAFPEEVVMKRLLLFDYFRGPDSTGLAAIRKSGDIHVAKVSASPLDLFQMKQFDKVLNGFQSLAFIGHNRFATKGKVTSFNAHPFEFDHIVGAHNGTLSQSSWKAIEARIGQEFEVDSQAVIAAIAAIGVEELMPMMQGAWALTWYDSKEKTLNFIRNKERPLWYAYSPDFKRMYWASEYGTIGAALTHDNKDLALHCDDKGFVYRAFAEDTLYSVPLEELVKGSDSPPEYRVKTLKGREAAPVTASPFPDHTGGKTTTTTSTGTESQSNNVVVNLFGNEDDPYGSYLDEKTFNRYAQYGCGFCGEDVNYGDTGIIIMEDLESVLCSECSKHTGRVDTKGVRIYSTNIASLL